MAGNLTVDRKSAENLMDVMAHLSTPIYRLPDVIKAFQNESEKELFWKHFRALTKVQMSILEDVVREFPEMDLTGQGEDYWFQLRKKYEVEGFPVRKMTAEEKQAAARAGKAAAAEILAENPELAPRKDEQ